MPNNGFIEFSNPEYIVRSKTLPIIHIPTMKSLFTDNATICYKIHSLSPSGCGTVRNSRWKSHKT